MPSAKNDPYSTQISENIFQLTNIAPISFDLPSIFGSFNQPALIRFFQQHQALGLDIAPFVFGCLVHAAVMLDGAEIFNPDGSGYLTSMNMFVQLIGEPGTNKSGLLRAFSCSMSVLSRIFPTFFSKPAIEVVNGKEKTTNIDLIVNNDTELSLFQKLSKRENVFICSDELDVMNIRFGVYLAGSMENDFKTIGSRLLCQGYDIIKNITRTTGSTSFHIDRGSINMFGASTGNMLSSIFKQYRSPVMSDGTVSRFIYVCTSAHRAVEAVPNEVLSVQPNIIHVLIVLRLLAEYQPIFIYGQYKDESDTATSVAVPADIEELIRRIDQPISLVEAMSTLKPSAVVPIQETDRETDGVLLSARSAIRRVIEYEHNKSVKTDTSGTSVFTPLQRAFQRKSSNKIARLGGLCYAVSYAIKICYECIDTVRYGDGLFLKTHVDDLQYTRLIKFRDCAKYYVKRKMAAAPTYGDDQRPLIIVNKAAVHAAELLYQYTITTIDALFDDKLIKSSVDNKKINDEKIRTEQPITNPYFEEQTIMLNMASPILLKAWFSNPVTGLPYTGIFKNYLKSKKKIERLTNALDYLIKTGLLQKGVGQTRHLQAARKETYMKLPPLFIRTDPQKLRALESVNINIETYEHNYMNSPLPSNMEITEETIKIILSHDNYISIAHLFNDVRIENEMKHRALNHVIQQTFVNGKKQYQIISSSQRIEIDSTESENIFECDFSLVSNNDSTLSTSHTPLISHDNSSSPYHEKSLLPLCPSLTEPNSARPHTGDMNAQNPNDTNAMSLEDEIINIEHELLDDFISLSSVIDNTSTNDTNHENILLQTTHNSFHQSGATNGNLLKTTLNVDNQNNQIDVRDHNQSNLTDLLVESAPHLVHILRNSQIENSTQSFEQICDSVENERYALKRYSDDLETPRKKRLKDHSDGNEVSKASESFINHGWDATNPSSFFRKKLSSTITIVNADIDERNDTVDNSTLISTEFHRSDVSDVNSRCNVATISSTDDILVDNVHNNNYPNALQNDLSSSVNTMLSSNVYSRVDQSSGANITNLSNNQLSMNTNEHDFNTSSTEKNDEKVLFQIYHKLILSESIVMTKTDVTLKLKHISASATLREQAIRSLLHDKLLVQGDWFSSSSIKGITNFSGYLKGFPENDLQCQIDFASSLAKYSIDFSDYELSFKKDKTGSFPRVLEASDIRHNKWLYSQALVNKIALNSFLKQRLSIDPSVVLRLSNIQSEYVKRTAVPRKRYSPSDNE